MKRQGTKAPRKDKGGEPTLSGVGGNRGAKSDREEQAGRGQRGPTSPTLSLVKIILDHHLRLSIRRRPGVRWAIHAGNSASSEQSSRRDDSEWRAGRDYPEESPGGNQGNCETRAARSSGGRYITTRSLFHHGGRQPDTASRSHRRRLRAMPLVRRVDQPSTARGWPRRVVGCFGIQR